MESMTDYNRLCFVNGEGFLYDVKLMAKCLPFGGILISEKLFCTAGKNNLLKKRCGIHP